MEPLFTDGKGRAVEVPDFGGLPVADTHAHLDMLDDPALALARAALAGVGFVATVADVTEDAWRTYEELPAWLVNASDLLVESGYHDVEPPDVRVILGAHPHNAKDWDAKAATEFRRLAEEPLTCAIGEIGLDYHYDHSPREQQRAAMAEHLRLAHEFDLPAVIHLREAHEDGEAILREIGMPPVGAILHCHTLGAEAMRPFVELGCHVSFAGPVTFKKSDLIREAAAEVPVGRLLTETDSPFMAPEPLRGRTCEPALVVFTAARMAEVRDDSLKHFAEYTYASARSLLDRARA